MEKAKLPTVVSSATFSLFGVEVRCHVLDDGQRVIEEGSVAELLSKMEEHADFTSLETLDAKLKELAQFIKGTGPWASTA